ncbi:hypothetical protein BDV93DRAFT_509670 [Ceratobasidium sp. AG-I]|nr:hypothetical protein BDV93DRAFT_509670 [Ceratobasidium sp. AG-I]
MSKRKTTSGGYEESSDDLQFGLDNSPERPPKRPTSVAYAPPRLTAASRSGPGSFQLPGASALARSSVPPSRHISLSSTSSRRVTPTIEGIHTPDVQTPEPNSPAGPGLGQRSNTIVGSSVASKLAPRSDVSKPVLLNDGPFKSACTAWRNMKKTDTDIEAMRSSARKYQRCDRKAGVRGVYIQTIPLLLGSEWEYLYNPGYVSPDESEEEGVLETNLYKAIQVAEREKGRARPGLYPRLPSTRIETVRRPIPHLERGTGSGKVTIRIALCGLSKSWREAYPDEIQKSTHLLNMKAVTKPDISAFLAKHPMPEIDSSKSVKDKPQPDYEPDDMELWAFGTQVEGQLGEGYGGVAHIPIDPALLCEDARHDGQHSGAEVWPLSSASKNLLGAPPPSFDMPPPPPLSNNAASAEVGTAVVNETSAKGKTKEQAAGVEGSVDTDAVPAAPKRRGRPCGSKNKPKEAVA